MVMIVRPESTTTRHGINLYASGVALLCFCSPAFAQSEAPAEQPAAQSAAAEAPQIGRAHVCTPVTNAHIVCRLPLEKKKVSTNTSYKLSLHQTHHITLT